MVDNFFGKRESLMLAFVTAVQRGNPDVVKIFFESGYIDIDDLDYMFGETALMHAARYNHLHMVKFLLKRNPDVNRASSEGGLTALHVAVSGVVKRTGNVNLINELLKVDRIDLEIPNKQGMTPLMAASSLVKEPEVSCLLKAGCDMTTVNKKTGLSAPHYCVRSEYFSSYPAVIADCFILYLQHRINPDLKDQSDVPLIGHAILKGNYQILCQLVYVNCDLDVSYKDGFEAHAVVHAFRRNQRFAKTLFEAGCDVTKCRNITYDSTLVQHNPYDAFSNSSRSLQQLCRIVIRKRLGFYPHTKIHKTNLPKALQDFVLLKDFIKTVELR